MRRIKLVLAALAVAVASFATISGPAMADELNCRDARGDLIRCDGDLYAPYNNYDYFNPYSYSYNPYSYFYNPYSYFYNPYSYFYSPYTYSSCPFWGDFEGPINQWDCFD